MLMKAQMRNIKWSPLEDYFCGAIVIIVVVVVEITLLTSILSGVTWTVAYSEF